MNRIFTFKLALFSFFFLSSASFVSAEICKGFGPQTPRDLTNKKGENSVRTTMAPGFNELNLCNIHFHKNAEHKASGFSTSGGEGEYGGWKCNETKDLTESQLAETKENSCKNVKAGDTVEVHWVYSSCDVEPGKGLGSCLSTSCSNPQLRVESKVFLLVNDSAASDFMKYSEGGEVKNYFQAKSLPDRKDALEFLGSTTGPKYTEKTCSPLQVTWNVSQSCETLNIETLSKWCSDNKFEENKAHGVRQIVTNVKLLSEIK